MLVLINRLLAAFPAGHSGLGAEVIDAYQIGLAEIPVEHIAQAVVNFLRGNVKGHNPAFAPSPPQVVIEARRIWKNSNGGVEPDLVVCSNDDPAFKAVEAMRGRPILTGKSGTATFRKSEIEEAMEAIK